MKIDYSQVDVVLRMPYLHAPWQSEEIPEGLLGARILFFGTLDNMEHSPEGGGLVIDFIPAGKLNPERLVFAFNEIGMWEQARIREGTLSRPDESPLPPSEQRP